MTSASSLTDPNEEPRTNTRLLGVPLDVAGLIVGPLVLVVWLTVVEVGLTEAQHRLAGIMLLTIVWWLTEPIPIPVTGLLAVVLSVVLGAHQPRDGEDAAKALSRFLAPFAAPPVFFLLGGMFIGQAMSRHGLDRRFALAILCSRWAGRSPATVLLGVGLAAGLISMFVSNTAATAMVYPVVLGVIAVLQSAGGGASFSRSPYASALLLMTAYASSVGGIATPIGTTTNVVAMGFFETSDYFGEQVDFVRWMAAGVPMMAVLFVALFLWLRILAPGGQLDMPVLRSYLQRERAKFGPWNRGERNTCAVFVTAVALWVAPGVVGIFDLDEARRFSAYLPEEMVAVFVPVLLYLLPVDWSRREATLVVDDLRRIDWGTLLLFGAGLTLGTLMFQTGLAEKIATAAVDALPTSDVSLITAACVIAGIVLSEFTSNAATAATLIPVVQGIALKLGLDPLAPLMGLTFGASFGSALPVSTPPNAIVYGSGLIPMRRMIAAGVVFDVLCAVVIWGVLAVALQFGWSPFLTAHR